MESMEHMERRSYGSTMKSMKDNWTDSKRMSVASRLSRGAT
jgi:hypothetical protein